MNKIELKHLNQTVYHNRLDNGLNVYVLPKNDVNNIYATFTTNYGSNEVEFVPIGEKKMIKVPLGIAHFLEHKMFEQEDGVDPFQFFGERGSDANANTNNYKTTYLFSGPEFFEENINCLLDYVQSPYFTDENVEKEKGIIEQEIKMYQDRPYTRLYEGITYNLFHNYPAKYPVIGTIESINKITKEDLYECYNTFYHPSNMILTIAGDIDIDEVMKEIKLNQSKKDYKKQEEVKIPKYKEEKEVVKKEIKKEKNIKQKNNISPLKVEKELTIKTNELNKLKEEYLDDKNCDNYILLEELNEKIIKLEQEINELEEIYLNFLE